MIRNNKYVYGEDLDIPSHMHFGKEMLSRFMEYSEHTALIDAERDRTMTFGDLAQKTVDIALSLTRIGVGKGDVITISSEMRMESIPTVLGVMCSGATFTLFNYDDPETLKATRPKVIFISQKYYNLYKKAFESIGCIEKFIIYGNEYKDGGENQDGFEIKDGEIWFKDFLTETANVSDFEPTPVDGWRDYALVKFTSGTLGRPKCVPYTHLATIMDTFSRASKRYRSSILITRNWRYSSGTVTTVSHLKRGITCVFTCNDSEEGLLQAIEKYKVTILQAIPLLVKQLIKSTILDQYDVSSVEYIISSITPLAKNHVEAVKKRLPNLRDVYQFYGMTETGCVCNSLHAPFGERAGSVGVPSHGFIIKVVDIQTREVLGCNQRGEICLKSPTLASGYLGECKVRMRYDPEGFYLTGDMGYYDADGYFYVVDRIDNLIQWNNETVAPAEIEALLDSLEQVKESGVAAVDGAPAAAVVLQPGAAISAAEVADYLHSMTKNRLEGGMYFVSKLPRNPGKKIVRRALFQMLNDEAKKNNKQNKIVL